MQKTILISIALFCIVFHSYGQFGLTLQLNSPSKDDIKLGWYNIDHESIDGYNLQHKSYSTGLFATYVLNEETSIRLRFGVTKFFIEEYRDYYFDGQTYFTDSNKGKQNKFHFAPGITWKFNVKKASFFGGFELPINIHHPFVMDYRFSRMDSSTDTISSEGRLKVTLPKGYSFGVGAIFGFNYFPASWISFGAEYSPSMLYAKLSGKTTSVRTYTVPSTRPSTSYTQDEDKGFIFYEDRFSINLSVWFSSKNQKRKFSNRQIKCP